MFKTLEIGGIANPVRTIPAPTFAAFLRLGAITEGLLTLLTSLLSSTFLFLGAFTFLLFFTFNLGFLVFTVLLSLLKFFALLSLMLHQKNLLVVFVFLFVGLTVFIVEPLGCLTIFLPSQIILFLI